MNKYYLSFFLVFLWFTPSYGQETSIQFPNLDFHMKMNQELKPSISYNAEANIVVGDKSGLILSLGVNGEELNLQSGLNDLIKLDTLKLSISPDPVFAFHTFYGRYKYLGQDPVISRGMQFNFTPGFNRYGYRTVDGAGVVFSFPVQDGRYEPELLVYSESFNGIDYLNTDFLATFRFEKFQMEIYGGIAIPTIGSIDNSIRGRFGFAMYTIYEIANLYFATYVPAHFGDKFEFDDIYIRFSQYLFFKGFEQTFSFTSLGAESGDITDNIIGYEGTPDLNIYIALGGRVKRVGFGIDYGFIYGLYRANAEANDIQPYSNRIGTYIDFAFLGLTYKMGMFYTLPGSGAYIKDVAKPGEVGLYFSVYGRT